MLATTQRITCPRCTYQPKSLLDLEIHSYNVQERVQEALLLAQCRRSILSQRDACAADDLPQQEKIPLGILLLPEESVGHCPCGIIHSPDQGEVGPPTFQPVVAAASHRQQHPFPGVVFPPAAMPGWSAPSRASQPRSSENAPDR